MEETYQQRITYLVNRIKAYYAIDENLFFRAVEFSIQAHKDQLYISGVPYIEHCLDIADILIDLRMDHETIIGGILHAVTIDTDVTVQEIREVFGENIYNLAVGLSQISELQFSNKEIKQEDILRKLILSIAKDVRVIIIKFADRLQKLRVLNVNLDRHNTKLIRSIAEETMAIYVPLAHRLGIARIKYELEELSFKFLNRDIYLNLKKRLAESREEQEKYINQIISLLRLNLNKAGIEAEITGRPKSIYSIHKKMVSRGYSFDKINDILAIRIIVKELEDKKEKYRDCYGALSVVQNLFRPIPELYSDFIQNPRDNGYQSIHIKVAYEPKLNGQNTEKIVEIQIRTDKMHDKAETGVAAHWLYKERKDKKDDVDEKLVSLREKILNDAKEPEKFIQSLNIDDLFRNEIFVFSPDHDLWQLPRDATPVDFAFHVHTDVGCHCIGAKVNGKIVQLNHKLKSGDTVEIITSNTQQPNQDWLKFVKTTKARNKIKRWIKDTQFKQSSELGEDLLHKVLKSYHIKLTTEKLNEIAKSYNHLDITKFYAAIGRGDITTTSILRKIDPEKVELTKDDSLLKRFINRAIGTDKAVKVQGLDNLLINFGKCCQPLPGDRIIGFITKGRGVVIHRTDCKNVPRLLDDADRNIDVQWAIHSDKRFVAKINMIAENNRVFLRDVTDSLASLNSNILSVDMKTKDSIVKNIMAIEVLNVNHLNRIINKVRKIKGIISVERVDGNGILSN